MVIYILLTGLRFLQINLQIAAYPKVIMINDQTNECDPFQVDTVFLERTLSYVRNDVTMARYCKQSTPTAKNLRVILSIHFKCTK